MTTERKRQQVNELTNCFEKAVSVTFTDFSGIPTREMETLREKIKEKEGTFLVTKNTLLNIAGQRSGFGELPQEITTGPTATLFSFQDPISGLKELYEFLKDHEGAEIKGGFLDKKPLTKQKIIHLAQLPSRQDLLANLVGKVQSPPQKLVLTLSNSIRKLIFATQQIRISKGGESE